MAPPFVACASRVYQFKTPHPTRRLGTSNGASFAIPGFGSMSLLGVTPHDIFVVERAVSANGVGRLIDLSRRRGFVPERSVT